MLVNRCIINPRADEVGSSSESGPAYAVGINNEFMKKLQILLELFYAQITHSSILCPVTNLSKVTYI